MEFIHGLNLDLDSVNKILKIAQKKSYIENKDFINTCNDFRFEPISKKFEFHFRSDFDLIKLELEMDKFIECYVAFIKTLE